MSTGRARADAADAADAADTVATAAVPAPTDMGPAPLRGWRRHVLVAVVVGALLALLALLSALVRSPQLPLALAADAGGRLIVAAPASGDAERLAGRVLLALGPPGAEPVPVDAALLHRVPRWQSDDDARARQLRQHAALAAALEAGRVQLVVAGEPGGAAGERVALPTRARGLGGLGVVIWPLLALALALGLAGVVAVVSGTPAPPASAPVLVLLLCTCQAGNLVLIALASLRGLGQPALSIALGLPLGALFDALSAAALLQLLARPPWPVAAAGWLAAAALAAGIATGVVGQAWWWLQGLCLALGLAAALSLRERRETGPDPRRRLQRRVTWTGVGVFALASLAVAATARRPDLAHGVAAGVAVAWTLFLASLLLLAPMLTRRRRLLREFALLAGISTVATSLDLLLVAVFSLDAQASLAVAMFAALAVYAGLRQRILERVMGAGRPGADRIFDALYRAARDVQAEPARHGPRLAQLLDELFEPLERRPAATAPARARVGAGGAELVVPVATDDDDAGRPAAWVLRLAQRGQRLFEPEDARLADRVVEQLRRAVAYDRAVARALERGRHEERQRLAQDLHDDIGARLLTLMYRAPNREIEDYIRHTLQDLKTLTRGLAATEHRLSDAAAEWKADLAQRMQAAGADLAFEFAADADPALTMVQWSALTRVLRELASNALFHGHATRVVVSLVLDGGELRLSVADDGDGCAPAGWSHGLGLGGVRKRVKQLGGRVAWRENAPRGIACDVVVERFVAAS